MSLNVTQVGYSQCQNFLSIKNDQCTVEPGSDKDLFIGKDINHVLTINNGETLEFRDVVLFGKLTIKSPNVNNTTTCGTLVARNVLTAGAFVCKLRDDQSDRVDSVSGNVCCVNVKLRFDYHYHAKNVPSLLKILRDVVQFWEEFQRETVKKIGLKSVLI